MKSFVKAFPVLASAVVFLLIVHGLLTVNMAAAVFAGMGAFFGWAFILHYSINVPKWWRSRFGRDAVTFVFLMAMVMSLVVYSTVGNMQINGRTWFHVALYGLVFIALYRRYVLYLWTRAEQLVEERRTGAPTDEKVPGEDADHPYETPDKGN